jgi:predicted secreted Zn-dependent protease
MTWAQRLKRVFRIDIETCLQTADRYEQEIAEVESEEQAQEVQTRLQQESIQTLEKHGWTPEQFNRVAEALNRNPALIERTLRLIEEKS